MQPSPGAMINVESASVNICATLSKSFIHESAVCCVHYSMDGEFLATGSNRSAQIFHAQTGQRVVDFVTVGVTEEENYVLAICFTPNSNWLITGDQDGLIKMYDVRNRSCQTLRGHEDEILSVDASAYSPFIISGSSDKKAKLWSLDTGTLLSTLGGEFGHTHDVTSVSVSPTRSHVATASIDKVVCVWDVETNQLLKQFIGHRDALYSVVFSPDGRYLLSGSRDKTVKLWDQAASSPSQQCPLSLTGHGDSVLSVAFSPNGAWLFSGSMDHSVRFWDARKCTTPFSIQEHGSSVYSIAHNPVSACLASAGSGDLLAKTWSYM